MDRGRGDLRRGVRRRRRGAGGQPRQAPMAAPAAGGRGAPRAGDGGRGAGRARDGAPRGRGGGRAGYGGGGRGGRGGGRGGRGGNGGRGQLHAQRRARPPVPPHLDDWIKNAKFGNPSGLNFEQLESQLDVFLTDQPRIDMQELDTYPVPGHQLNQGQNVVPLLREASEKCRKMSFTRKMLLKMYLQGNYISLAADYWRKSLAEQEIQLDDTLYELRRLNARYRPMPDIFLTKPSLMPKNT